MVYSFLIIILNKWFIQTARLVTANRKRYIWGNYKQILQYYNIIAFRKRLSKPQQGRNWLPFLTVQQLTKRVSSRGRGRYLRELKQLFRRCISLFLFGVHPFGFAIPPNALESRTVISLSVYSLFCLLQKRLRLFLSNASVYEEIQGVVIIQGVH